MADEPVRGSAAAPGLLPAIGRAQGAVIIACVAIIVALAWAYLVLMGTEMMPMGAPSAVPVPTSATDTGNSMAGMDMAGMDMKDMSMEGMNMGGQDPAEESASAMAGHANMGGALSFGLLAAMWIVMMVGMMLPSATPMIVMAARVGQARSAGGYAPLAGAGVFGLGYLIVWVVFSLVAAAAQTGLQQALLVDGHAMTLINPIISGVVLIAAGAYQWSPLKRICLSNCRSPMGFLMARWRPGTLHAVRIGAGHGFYCLGCCWVLMALLFVAGVMALPWVAALAVFVLLEKVAPKGEWIGRAGGVAMIGAGIYFIVAG